MTDVDLLREAAAKMRERAAAATPSPWSVFDMEDKDDFHWWWVWRDETRPYYGGILEIRRDEPKDSDLSIAAHGIGGAAITDGTDYDQEQADAEHIASWHPTIALDAASLLEAIADRIDGAENPAAVMADDDIAMSAFLFARNYLGRGQ